jgi:DNA-directed RNA polymerase subunit RPC12/RpoP
MDEFKRAAAGGSAAGEVKCEQCGRRMMLKFTTLRLTESGKVRVYECIDCERLTFISEPSGAAPGACSPASPKPASPKSASR